jgi:hypothetical protein
MPPVANVGDVPLNSSDKDPPIGDKDTLKPGNNDLVSVGTSSP